MTRIDFYILAASEQKDADLFACKLIEKAYKKDHRILLVAKDASHAIQLDQLLWSFRESSFVPHQRLAEQDRPNNETGSMKQAAATAMSNETCVENCPIEISYAQQQPDPYHQHHDVLINLSQTLLTGFSRFERCIEIVVQQQDVLNASRENYKFYKARGYPLHQHDMRK